METEPMLEYDEGTKSLLLDLFTEIAILEHLVRFRFGPEQIEGLSPAQFGILNHFVLRAKPSEKLTTLAWSFQVELADARATVKSLAARRLLEVDWLDGDECVFITDAGRDIHEAAVKAMAPDVLEIVAEITPENLRITADTLKEIRRTFDNLPGR